MPTKILHVTMRLGAGIATAIRQYAEALPEAQHALAASSAGWAPCPDYGAGFDNIRILPRQWRNARSVISELISSGSFDVEHAHSSHAGALVRTLPFDVRVVYAPHALASLAPRFSSLWWAGQTERLFGLRGITIAAVSDDEACRARRMSPRSRVVRLTNLPTVQARGTARYCDPLRVAGCGRLTPQKHPEFFAAVARLSSAADLPFTFTWVGDGPAHYRKLLLRSGVTVTGWLSSDDVAKQLAQCTVFLHTALYEGSPFALLDAAALGLPVVGRPVPGLRELHWIRHMTTPRKALDVLQSMSGRETWSVSSQATTTAIHQLTRETQRLQLLRAYGLVAHA